MKNPSERLSGRVRFYALTRSLDLWAAVSRRVAERLRRERVVAIRDVLSALRLDGFAVFSDSVCYSNVRLARALISACGYSISDTEEDWAVLRGMSPSVRRLCDRWDLSHGAAIAVRDGMREHYPDYTFLDLSCFLCLAEF